ncbi:MAG: tRNA (N6-isopentenyl adenosine(37)-C2)-methylthiotransferase MiaB [Deltaproteobacteria bacterium]|nr:tRNA (N6-isopentenyl adenosine(37)-C2)-methylthiotransferase MiaB [Deltaproteobacteria bacterium]
MNLYDSERLYKSLSGQYEPTSSEEEADLILYNTCSVRGKSEQKIRSTLGEIKDLKKKKPHLVIGVGGCVATQEGKKLLNKVSHLDLVFGVDQIEEILLLIEKAKKKERLSQISFKEEYSFYATNTIVDNKNFSKVSSYVSIIQGCEKPCTFCIVPTTRGFEKSRNPQEVINEIQSLVDAGTKEIILLGQNVNAYRTKNTSFEDLITLIEKKVTGLKRLRYITSHPNDVSKEIVQIHKESSLLAKHIHMPIQAGSTRILKRMARLYSKEEYLEKVESIRSQVKNISISSDIIVGFPGERDVDFEETLDVVRKNQFDQVYAFKYSPRPGTPSKEKLNDDIPEEVKDERLQKVLDVVDQVMLQGNKLYEGKEVEVLVEGASKTNPHMLTGRTSNNRIINFPGDISLKGELLPIQIKKALVYSLEGSLS